MKEDKIVQPALIALLRQNGLKAKWKERQDEIDGELILTLANQRTQLFVEVKRELRVHHLPKILEKAKHHRPFMVIAEQIFPKIKHLLREEKIAYLDGAGNIFVHAKDIYIWIDGHKPVPTEKAAPNRAFTKTGLKMIFHLLRNNGAINTPYRQLAKETGIALGAVKNVMDGLRQSGFLLDINRQTIKLQNKPKLLERWITGYRETLKPAMHLGIYRFTEGEKFQHWETLPIEPAIEAWGGEPAAEYYTHNLKPGILTFYTEQPKTALMIKWRLVPDAKGKLLIYQKFWKDEPIHAENNVIVAPPLLVYTDLLLTEDPRCIENAQVIYEQLLKHEIE